MIVVKVVEWEEREVLYRACFENCENFGASLHDAQLLYHTWLVQLQPNSSPQKCHRFHACFENCENFGANLHDAQLLLYQ